MIYKIGISILIFLSIGFYTYTEFNQNKLRGKITESVVNFTQIKLTDDFIIKESKKIDKSIFPIRLKIPKYDWSYTIIISDKDAESIETAILNTAVYQSFIDLGHLDSINVSIKEEDLIGFWTKNNCIYSLKRFNEHSKNKNRIDFNSCENIISVEIIRY